MAIGAAKGRGRRQAASATAPFAAAGRRMRPAPGAPAAARPADQAGPAHSSGSAPAPESVATGERHRGQMSSAAPSCRPRHAARRYLELSAISAPRHKQGRGRRRKRCPSGDQSAARSSPRRGGGRDRRQAGCGRKQQLHHRASWRRACRIDASEEIHDFVAATMRCRPASSGRCHSQAAASGDCASFTSASVAAPQAWPPAARLSRRAAFPIARRRGTARRRASAGRRRPRDRTGRAKAVARPRRISIRYLAKLAAVSELPRAPVATKRGGRARSFSPDRAESGALAAAAGDRGCASRASDSRRWWSGTQPGGRRLRRARRDGAVERIDDGRRRHGARRGRHPGGDRLGHAADQADRRRAATSRRGPSGPIACPASVSSASASGSSRWPRRKTVGMAGELGGLGGGSPGDDLTPDGAN